MNYKLHQKHYILLFGITTILSTAIIFGFSLQNGTDSSEMSGSIYELLINWGVPISEHVLRKMAHVTIYFNLGLHSTALGISMLWNHESWRYRLGMLVGIGYSFLCACLDEWSQYHTVGRDGRFLDVGIDAIGFCASSILVVVMIIYIMKRK